MLISKKKPKLDMSLIDNLVSSYFSYIKATKESLTCSEISEIMRYSMCKAQGLDTKGYSERVERLGVGSTNVLVDVLKREHMLNQPEDVKRGLLEACVHCTEMSRKRVLEVG